MGAHGNSDTWVIFSPLTPPVVAQETELAPAATAVINTEEPDAGEEWRLLQTRKGVQPQVLLPSLVAAPAAALELGLNCSIS